MHKNIRSKLVHIKKEIYPIYRYAPTSRIFNQFSKNLPFIHSLKSSNSGQWCEKRFFEVIEEYKEIEKNSCIPLLISNELVLEYFLDRLDIKTKENYLIEQFTYWLSWYAKQEKSCLHAYFSDQANMDLTPVCNDFIRFCFRNNINLYADKTLESFKQHNKLTDNAVKAQLSKLPPKAKINILGFGLDDGCYEKTIADFLVEHNIAKEVSIYGFDPYAVQSNGIQYLASSELENNKSFKFDLIIARWVLHHIEHQQRWENFIRCINHCTTDAFVLVIEHGFLNRDYSLLDRKIYYLLNATFDIIANIGLRPRYFTSNPIGLGTDFYINYLTAKDFTEIRSRLAFHTSQEIYNIGPNFPNQTINCICIDSEK